MSPGEELTEEEIFAQRKGKAKQRATGVMFYATLIAVIVSLYMFVGMDSDGTSARHFFGHAFMRVLTGSMADYYPEGSMVVVQAVDPADIQVGDDITFMRNETHVVTHRVRSIIEQHSATGERAFVTYGTNNQRDDDAPAHAVNVIGRVVWNNYPLGRAFFFIQDNAIVIGIVSLAALIFIIAIRYFMDGEAAAAAAAKKLEEEQAEQELNPEPLMQ